MEKKIVGKCLCGGNVLEESKRVCSVPPGMRIIGPGGKKQYYTKTEYYCEKCGIMYKFPPPLSPPDPPDMLG